MVGPTPNRNLLVALQDHFAVDGLGESDIGLSRDCSAEQKEKCGFFYDGVAGL